MNKYFIALLMLFCNVSWAIPNPASEFCVQKGGKLILKNESGYCVFKGNSYCEEWAYFRGECKPGKLFFKNKK